MNTTAHDDRRHAYRYRPPVVMEPIFNIINNGKRLRADSVIDINLRGARVSFSQSPELSSGQSTTVSIQAPGLDGCVDIPSRIVFSAQQDSGHLVALVFSELPELDGRADPSFFSVFNRRQDERQVANAHVSAVVLADNKPSDEATGFDVRVVNHTSKGIAFVVNLAVDRIIDGREAINLAVHSPEFSRPQRVSARVLHRAVRADAVYYGCMFNHA